MGPLAPDHCMKPGACSHDCARLQCHKNLQAEPEAPAAPGHALHVGIDRRSDGWDGPRTDLEYRFSTSRALHGSVDVCAQSMCWPHSHEGHATLRLRGMLADGHPPERQRRPTAGWATRAGHALQSPPAAPQTPRCACPQPGPPLQAGR